MSTFPHTFDSLDQAVLNWAQHFIGRSDGLDWLLVVVGQWLVYLVPVGLLIAWLWLRYGHRVKDWALERISLLELTVAGLIGWQGLSRLIKLIYYRDRPLVAGSNVKELFFHRPDNSFPSDHSAFFFGLATYAYLLGWHRTGHGMLIAAILVSMARIATGTHWLTDIIVGALIGVAGAYLLWWLRKPFEQWIGEPLEALISQAGL
ncbi:phosphatase PAP2 family protein [Candidatus Berkelbacteria bacterium]|nr:phosphatase PAP2 family protein [Candidatus Berkelbacteria bacterium]